MSKHNTNEIWLHVTAGQGPDECALAVAKFIRHLQKKAKAQVLALDIADSVEGDKKGTVTSALIKISGQNAEQFLMPYMGTIKWVCESPYRPRYKRKNWFIGVERIAPVRDTEITINPEDVTWKTMRASGPGGQHVNTTDSAVQATHKPSGLQVIASDARSQHANKKIALAKLEMILRTRQEEKTAESKKNNRDQHHALERGNAVKTFTGKEFIER